MSSRHAILALLTSVAVLSGCSTTDTATRPPDSATDQNAPAAADCGNAVTKVKEFVASTKIRDVTVNGQCTTVTIDTELDDENTADGKEICEAAGKVVYTGDINSVRVRSKSGTELSTGIDGAPCLP